MGGRMLTAENRAQWGQRSPRDFPRARSQKTEQERRRDLPNPSPSSVLYEHQLHWKHTERRQDSKYQTFQLLTQPLTRDLHLRKHLPVAMAGKVSKDQGRLSFPKLGSQSPPQTTRKARLQSTSPLCMHFLGRPNMESIVRDLCLQLFLGKSFPSSSFGLHSPALERTRHFTFRAI